MRVRVDDLGLFDCGDREVYAQLRRLFERASQGQHELDLPDPGQVLASEFMQVACAEMDRPTWEELLLWTPTGAFDPAEEPRRYAIVTRDDRARGGRVAFVVTPEDAGRWAEQPLQVLLENTRDSVLVRLAARVTTSPRLQRALDEGWLKPDGCGGTGEVHNRVKDATLMDRLFVLIDSDREEPNGAPSGKASKICEGCGNAGVEVYVLRRRELENYVPEVFWQELVPPKPKGGKTERSHGVQQRAVLVYRWVLKLIERNRSSGERYGKDALQGVVKALQREAQRDLESKLVQRLLRERRAMRSEEKHVDDLKVRFGEKLAKKAVAKLSDTGFDPGCLDPDAADELRSIAALLEEWL